MWSKRLTGILVGAITVLAAAPSAADDHEWPRAMLEASGTHTGDYYISTYWTTRDGGDCVVLHADPPAGAPRALEIPDGRRRIKVVIFKRDAPRGARVDVFRPNGDRVHKRVHVTARRNDDGLIVAWKLRFTATLHEFLDIWATARWRDEQGCDGPQRVTYRFRVKS